MSTATLLSPETKAKVEEAFEDGKYAAKRAITSVRRGVEDLSAGVTYRMKKEPIKTAAIALGLGVVLGTGVGLLIGRSTRRTQ